MSATPDSRTIFTNGLVYTGTEDAPQAATVTVENGRIVSVEDAAAPIPDSDTATVIDLQGKLLMPGFQDAHAHPINGGMELLSCDLTPFTTAQECLDFLVSYAAEHPELTWITGGGWSVDMFEGGNPTRGALDAILPNIPVFIVNRDHHSAWFNTKAAELAGITAETPDPSDGRFEREPSGMPAGAAHEGAMTPFNDVRPQATPEQGYEGLLAGQEYLLSCGVTGWQDAAVGFFMGSPNGFDVYHRAVAEGTLKARVRGAQWWSRVEGIEQLERVLTERERATGEAFTDRLSFGSVKIMVDGVAESFTAAMHDCYLDHHGHATDNRGLTYFPSKDLAQIVAKLDALDIQVHFHALGDRAVTESLDAIEYAITQNGQRGNRHHLAHLQIVRESDVPRFAELGATANLQALWAAHDEQLDELTLPFMLPELEARHYPFGELVAAGSAIAAGSDWPVSTPNPIAALHVAVNRADPELDLEPLTGAEQKLTVKQFVDAYTQGSARINFLEDRVGLIAPGYYADFAVLSADVFSIAPSDLHTVTVDQTWVDGALVFERQ